MSHDPRPRIAITVGDPAGVGPEIALRSMQQPELFEVCVPILFGPVDVVEHTAETLGLDVEIVVGTAREVTSTGPGHVGLVATSGDGEPVPYGQVNARGGTIAVEAVRAAVDAALADEVQAVSTGPLNKESMRLAGYSYDGHTEMLKEFCNADAVTMLLLGDQLRVAHLTTHTSLGSVPGKITVERILDVTRIAAATLRRLGFTEPRITVAGLNPHSGEHGLFGDEEGRVMVPAIQRLREEGIDVRGPVSPDTVFIDNLACRTDLVVAAYHDQGHIPVKLIEREKAVNVTGGLPIVRTSVDHGTAFDIAGKGVASIVNMISAVHMAARLSGNREGRPAS